MTGEGRFPSFEDDVEAQNERRGFIDPYGYVNNLPGSTWQEGNMFNGRAFVPNCNMEDAVFNDTVWQFGRPDRLRVLEGESATVLGEIFFNDGIRRLQAIEQLTLPPDYTTIPNTGAFSRFEHVWGSVLFVRQIAEKHGITGKAATELQLRTLVSDVAHTFGSHLGDWMFQGVGGAENQHDIELESYLEAVGINDILRKHDFDPQSVIFPDINDWVEASQPDLCVDRVDYGLREMNRWNDVVHLSAFTADDFILTPENMLAMKDQQRARIFAEGFLLLSQEHWSEPTHRFMLDMLMLRTKLFYAEGRAPRSWVFAPGDEVALMPLHEIHPRDLMYVTDPAQMQAYALPNLGGHTIDAIMKSVAQYRRQYVWPGRRERINQYMSQFSDNETYRQGVRSGHFETLNSPVFHSYLDEYPQTLPGGFAILDGRQAAATKNDISIDLAQPSFKTRQIDPLVETHTGFRRLSDLDKTYAARLDEHKATMAVEHVARIVIPDPTTNNMLHQIVNNVEAGWKERLENTRRMTPQELQALVSVSAREIHGTYPFMTFYSY